MRKTFCDVCNQEIEYPHQWDVRLTAGREHFPKERGEVSVIFPPHAILDKDACSAKCFRKLLMAAIAEVDALP